MMAPYFINQDTPQVVKVKLKVKAKAVGPSKTTNGGQAKDGDNNSSTIYINGTLRHGQVRTGHLVAPLGAVKDRISQGDQAKEIKDGDADCGFRPTATIVVAGPLSASPIA